MTIESHEYQLDSSVDVPALQFEICDAMRNGGGIVNFAVARGRSLTAVFSPGVPVMFEDLEIPASDEATLASEAAFVDHDFEVY